MADMTNPAARAALTGLEDLRWPAEDTQASKSLIAASQTIEVETRHDWPDVHVPRRVNFGDLSRAVRDLDGGRLSGSERAFLNVMLKLGFDHAPSPRQRAWLTAIFGRLLQEAA